MNLSMKFVEQDARVLFDYVCDNLSESGYYEPYSIVFYRAVKSALEDGNYLKQILPHHKNHSELEHLEVVLESAWSMADEKERPVDLFHGVHSALESLTIRP